MKEKIINFLSEKFEKTVSEKTELVELCEDSISRVETLFDIEMLIDKKIPEEDIFTIENVGDLIKVANKL